MWRKKEKNIFFLFSKSLLDTGNEITFLLFLFILTAAARRRRREGRKKNIFLGLFGYLPDTSSSSFSPLFHISLLPATTNRAAGFRNIPASFHSQWELTGLTSKIYVFLSS